MQIAVIDTETNWADAVMSIGIVLADRESLRMTDCRYYIFKPECLVGGMYEDVLKTPDAMPTAVCTRQSAMEQIRFWLEAEGVEALFAYNARFDSRHLPELGEFCWYDIMKIAAYRQHNPSIPADAPCCSTGRLRSHYGVEPTLRRLTGDPRFRETHNALLDASDELHIMQLLRLTEEKYPCCRI